MGKRKRLFKRNLIIEGTCNYFFWMDKIALMSAQGGSWQKDAADQNFDYMFKLLIIGNSSVGKTSFLFRYADDSFTSAFVSTVGIDFKVKTVFRQDKRVKLQIWDTAGQERDRTITTAYYRGAMGFILMYDVTNEESFSSVHDWCTQIKTYSWDNAQVILVGNKSDMEDERVISFERGKQLADSLGLEFFETSAKENINVRAVFERLVDIICDKMSESLDSDPTLNTNKGTRLDNAQPTRNYLSSRTTKDDNDIYKSIIKPFILLTFFFGFLSGPSKNTFQIFWAAAKLFLTSYGQTKEQATLNVNFNGDFKFSLRENYCNMRDGESFP